MWCVCAVKLPSPGPNQKTTLYPIPRNPIAPLTVHEVRHQLVHDVLHRPVEADVLQRMGLVDNIFTRWAGIVFL